MIKALLLRLPFSIGDAGKKILVNSSWNLFQQVLTIISGSVISILLVRAMTVEDYGIYSYAIALCGIGASIMTAGLSGLAVKEFVDFPDETSSTMSALLLVREAFALIGFVLIGVISFITAENHLVAATLLASLALFGRAMDAPEYWYLANLQSRRTVSLRVTIIATMILVRILAMFIFPNVTFFLAAYAAEAIIIGALIFNRYMKDTLGKSLELPKRETVQRLLKQSLPLMLSSVASQINLRGDIVIIQAILGVSAVSIYSAAARISEISHVIPIILMNSLFPAILNIRRANGEDSHKYLNTLQKTYDVAFWGGVLVAVGMYVAGSLVIHWVFGAEYAESQSVLAIHVLSCPFIFMAAVYSKWIIAEGILWTSLLRHGLGAISNIALCMYLIPRMGVEGAAVATLISYVVASYLSCFAGGSKNRQAGMAMTRAFIAPVRYLGAMVR